MHRFTVEVASRLDRYLVEQFPDLSRTRIARAIEEGLVSVNGTVATKSGTPLKPGFSVECLQIDVAPIHDLTPTHIELDIVFEDDSLIVINKPRGLATHPAPSLKEPSLVNALLAHSKDLSTVSGDYRPGIVHRLDKETTGLIVVAKTDVVHRALAHQFAKKSAERRYLAWIQGQLDQPQFRIEAPIARDPANRLRMAVNENGRFAATETKVVLSLGDLSLVAVRLETGRTHQIRVHLRAIGHAVAGDTLYGGPKGMPLQLHAGYLRLYHPVLEREIGFQAPPPEDFLQIPNGPTKAMNALTDW